MQYVLKNTPKITLVYLLHRRKVSLNDFILNRGIKSYDELCSMCRTMGCQEPEEQLYTKCLPVEKKIETDVQINKKRRKQSEILIEQRDDVKEEQLVDVSTT